MARPVAKIVLNGGKNPSQAYQAKYGKLTKSPVIALVWPREGKFGTYYNFAPVVEGKAEGDYAAEVPLAEALSVVAAGDDGKPGAFLNFYFTEDEKKQEKVEDDFPPDPVF